MSQYFFDRVGVDLGVIGELGGVFTIPPNSALFNWNGFGGDFNVFPVDYSDGTIDSATHVSAVLRSDPSNVYYLYPSYFTINDPFGAHHSYASSPFSYPSIADYTIFSGGSVIVPVTWSGHNSGTPGVNDPSTTGFTGSNTLTIALPQNITVSASGSLPGVSSGFTATGCLTGSPVFSVSSGALPDGVTLNSDGTISGTPTRTQLYAFTITAQNYLVGSYCYGYASFAGIVVIGDGGVIVSGSNIDDPSGIYFLDSNLTHDILYSAFLNAPKDVKIPDPFVKTAYIGG